MKLIVTTTSRPDITMIEKAKEIAKGFNVPYLDREGKSLKVIREEFNNPLVLIVSKAKEILNIDGHEYYFHPSLAKVRIKALRKGEPDHMVQALNLEKGDQVLDCTLGLGADAIVASYIVGSQGKVYGVESSTILSFIVGRGLKQYKDPDHDLVESMSRLKVINRNYKSYLKEIADKSFDVIYFDPMFRTPIEKSDALASIRSLTNNEPLQLEDIYEAKRIARKRVIVKARRDSTEFSRLGIKTLCGGKYSSIAFGIIEVSNKC